VNTQNQTVSTSLAHLADTPRGQRLQAVLVCACGSLDIAARGMWTITTALFSVKGMSAPNCYTLGPMIEHTDLLKISAVRLYNLRQMTPLACIRPERS